MVFGDNVTDALLLCGCPSATPVPVRVTTVCADALVLSTRSSVPTRLPEMVGWNVALKDVLLPGWMVSAPVPPSAKSAEFAPPRVALETIRSPSPVLLTVIVFTAEVAPTDNVPYSTAALETEILGAVACPLRATE